MADVAGRSPYRAAIAAILSLRERKRGWDSYGADPVKDTALLSAIDLVNRFGILDAEVPVPEVGASPDGGVVLRWITPEREVDVLFRGATAEYSVLRRDTDEVVEEERLERVDAIKDVIVAHVLGQRSLSRR